MKNREGKQLLDSGSGSGLSVLLTEPQHLRENTVHLLQQPSKQREVCLEGTMRHTKEETERV